MLSISTHVTYTKLSIGNNLKCKICVVFLLEKLILGPFFLPMFTILINCKNGK